MKRIIIIGAGASGMAAAVTAAKANQDACIILLEKQEKPGSKLLATGNGRCNITNIGAENYRSTLTFFESMGLIIRQESEGRMYPYSGRSRDVVLAFERALKAGNVDVRMNCEAEEVIKNAAGFSVKLKSGETLTADRVLIAAGGKAGPQYGTVGDSYRLAKKLGHSITTLAPALTMLKTESTGNLKGIRAKAKAALYKGDRLLAEEIGEVQFTESGLSGICIFNLSRLVNLENSSFSDYSVHLDYVHEMSMSTAKALIEAQSRVPGMKSKEVLSGIVDSRIAERIFKAAGSNAENLAGILKDDRFTVSGAGGWKEAQCTRGGVPVEEVNEETMESKIVPGLYLSGEVLNYDGPCGGYNLQHAWETGIKAGKAMVG